MKCNLTILSLLATILAGASAALAGNVDLSTVPKRDSVQLTIYNSEDLTLVRETRSVTFKKGVNPLEFSWANTLIDPTSVDLKFLTHAAQLDLLDTTFPHDKPQKLYWNVQSDFDGEATIEITYFTSGITWSADYLCIADAAERAINFEGFVRVTNNSGEEYENAQVRLVVGTINLVEKIAQLARMPADRLNDLSDEKRDAFKREALSRAMNAPAKAQGFRGEAKGGPQLEEKQIVKEGLSEYFIYTIEGTETIPNGWSKRMRSLEAAAAPIKIEYRYRPQEYGDQLVRMYLLANNKKSKLGTSPLPDGIVRVFRQQERGGLSYLTQQAIKYIPIGDKIELNLGVDPEVVFELIKLRASRSDLWLQVNGADVLHKVGDPGLQVDPNQSVVGWDDHSIFTQRIRNYSPHPIAVEIRRTFPGHIVFRSNLNPKLHDFQTAQFTSTVEAGKRADLLFELIQHQGRSAKQNNVTLEAGGVAP